MMQVEVVFFASLRDRARTHRTTIDLQNDVTVGDFLNVLSHRYPDLSSVLPFAVVAINQEYASQDAQLNDGDEVAVFPPVSGGGCDKCSGGGH
jgi:molybdopterin converting factor subunit 1